MVKRRRISTPARRTKRRTKLVRLMAPRRLVPARAQSNVVPRSKVVKLRYVDQFTLDANAGLVSSRVYRANSIHDPDFSGLGHQPLGHDQWGVFYNHYNVIGSKITAKYVSTGIADNAADASMVGILLKDNTTVIIDPKLIMEQTNSGYGILTQADANQTKTIRKGYSTKRFFDVQDVKDNRQLLGATFGTTPTEEAYFHVYQAALNTNTHDPGPILVIITIEYLVQLTERKSLSAS